MKIYFYFDAIRQALSEDNTSASPENDRAQAALRILEQHFEAIYELTRAVDYTESELLRRIARLTQEVHQPPIEELIAASSLGTPEVAAARASVDPTIVQRVLDRAGELSRAHPGRCPCCKQEFSTPDHDPFCSSCVESGWSTAYQRGWADHQTFGAP